MTIDCCCFYSLGVSLAEDAIADREQHDFEKPTGRFEDRDGAERKKLRESALLRSVEKSWTTHAAFRGVRMRRQRSVGGEVPQSQFAMGL